MLYLLLILFQLAVFTSEEIRYFYRVLCKHLRLTCYEITFTDLERPKVLPEKPKQEPKPQISTQQPATPAETQSNQEANPQRKDSVLSRASSFAKEEWAKNIQKLKKFS